MVTHLPFEWPARAARQAAHAEFVRWLQDRAASVAGADAAGNMKPLWALVRWLSGRRKTKGPRAIALIRRLDVSVAATPAAVADTWQEMFAAACGSA